MGHLLCWKNFKFQKKLSMNKIKALDSLNLRLQIESFRSRKLLANINLIHKAYCLKGPN